MKIIIADDDNIIREGLKMIISSQPDFEIVGVGTNGAEAIELCRQHKVDIALLDIRMPVKDGITAAETMLADNLCKPLLLTTFDEQELIERALKIGVSGYILGVNPFDQPGVEFYKKNMFKLLGKPGYQK